MGEGGWAFFMAGWRYDLDGWGWVDNFYGWGWVEVYFG